jgi:GntR family transcriptional regulator
MTDLLELEGSGEPAYRDIAKALHGELLTGTWRPGSQIPPEAELEKRFGVSRGTMRAAIMQLVRAGLLDRQPGRGTFVLSPQFTNSFSQFFSFERKDREAPIAYDTGCVRKGIVPADASVAEALQLRKGARVGHARRVRSHAGEPFLVEDSYFPLAIWNEIGGADFTVSLLYEEIRERFDVHMLTAEEYLTAEPASAEFAKIFSIRAGTPVIRIERKAYTFNREPAEYRASIGRSDKFRYHARLR